jgi:hypothetical protein
MENLIALPAKPLVGHNTVKNQVYKMRISLKGRRKWSLYFRRLIDSIPSFQ